MAFIHLVKQEIVNNMNTQIKISTLIITAVSALLFYASFVIGDSENYLFPRLIAGTIAALTLLLYFEKGDPDKSTNFKDLFPGLTIAIAYILLLLSFLGVDGYNSGGNLAHLGGVIFGFLYIKSLTKTQKSKANNNAFIKYLTKIFTSLKSQNSEKENKKNNQKEIDIVLEKISKSGYNSLNKNEKDLLFKASKK